MTLHLKEISMILILKYLLTQSKVHHVLSSNDTTESYNEFFNIFSTVYERSFPMTKMKV